MFGISAVLQLVWFEHILLRKHIQVVRTQVLNSLRGFYQSQGYGKITGESLGYSQSIEVAGK